MQRTKNQQESFGELTLTEKRRSFDPFDFSNIPPMFMQDEEVPRADHPENPFYDPDPDKTCPGGMFADESSQHDPGEICFMCGKIHNRSQGQPGVGEF